MSRLQLSGEALLRYFCRYGLCAGLSREVEKELDLMRFREIGASLAQLLYDPAIAGEGVLSSGCHDDKGSEDYGSDYRDENC